MRAWDLYNVGNDMDLYREWAMPSCTGRPSQRPSRRFAAGIIALRPDRDGRIAHYDGLDEIRDALRRRTSSTGTCRRRARRRSGVEAGYMANAWIRMKHRDYDTLRAHARHRRADREGARVMIAVKYAAPVVLLGPQRFDPTLGDACSPSSASRARSRSSPRAGRSARTTTTS